MLGPPEKPDRGYRTLAPSEYSGTSGCPAQRGGLMGLRVRLGAMARARSGLLVGLAAGTAASLVLALATPALADRRTWTGLRSASDVVADPVHGHLFTTEGARYDTVLVTDLSGRFVTALRGL